MSSLWLWFKAKFGRIITAVGTLLSGVETFDITPIKDPIEGLTSHKFVLGLMVICFVLSYLRHQYVASKVAPK